MKPELRPAEDVVPERVDADAERDRRDLVVRLVALGLALLVAVLLLLFTQFRLPKTEEPPTPVVRWRFVDAPPAPEPEKPPETNVRSQRNSEAQTPVPQPEEPPRPVPVVPPPQPPARPPQPRPRPTPPPPRPKPEPRERRRPIESARPIERQPTPPVEERPTPSVRDLLGEMSRETFNSPPSFTPPEPGGAAPLGPGIMFESQADVDWGPYAARIKPIVRGNWRAPVAAQMGTKGVVHCRFDIMRDGSIENLEIVSASGTGSLDVAARDAIRLSNKLPPPPLPEDHFEDSVGVNWIFFYNYSSREIDHWDRQQRLNRVRQQRRR
ncbi:MAG: TonB family protein [Acidobacteriota bacterium]